MTLPFELGKKSATGTSNVFLGMAVSTAILAVGTIIVANLLGSDLYGLYSLAQVPIGLLNLVVSFGVYHGIARYSSQYYHRNETEKTRAIITSGLRFLAIAGSIFALAAFLLSNSLANFVGRPTASILIEVFSLTILTEALFSGSMYIFVSLERTQYYTALLILQAAVRSVVSPTLVVIGFGPLGAVVGYAASSLSISALALSIVFFLIWKRLRADHVEDESSGKTEMLIRYGAPLYIRDLILVGISTHFLNFLMILYSNNALIGNYKVALNFLTALNFIATPISLVIFPTLSKLNIKSDHEAIKTIFVSSVKYTGMLIVPAIAALFAISEPLVLTLYRWEDYSLSPFYLSLGTLTYIYQALGQASIVHLFSSQGETRKAMILGTANAAVTATMALILIPRFQIVGLIVSMIVGGAPTVILGSWWVKRLYGFSIDWNQTARILASSVCTGAITFAAIRYFLPSNLLGLVVSVLIFSASFLVLTPLMGAINLDDVVNLRGLFGETAILSKFLEFPFWLLAKSCGFAERAKKRIAG